MSAVDEIRTRMKENGPISGGIGDRWIGRDQLGLAKASGDGGILDPTKLDDGRVLCGERMVDATESGAEGGVVCKRVHGHGDGWEQIGRSLVEPDFHRTGENQAGLPR